MGDAAVITSYTAPSALRALDRLNMLTGTPLLMVGNELRRGVGVEEMWRDFAVRRGMTPQDAHAAWLSFPHDDWPDVIESWAMEDGWSPNDARLPAYDPRDEQSPWSRLVATTGIDYVAEHIAHPAFATTGIDRLDQALGGGIVGGTYTVIGGEGGVGKTALATIAAYHIACSGKWRALVFSAEITRKQMYDRLLAVHTRAHPERFRHEDLVWWSKVEAESDTRLGTEETMRLWMADESELNAAKVQYLLGDGADDPVIAAWRDMESVLGGKLVVVDEGVTCDRICEIVRELRKANEPVVPIIDHMHAIAPPEGVPSDKEYESITAISHRLRDLAKECRCPMLVLSELRNINKSERDEPSLSWFRGSGHVGYDAGTAIVLMRGEDVPEGRAVKAHVLKNRRGESGAVLDLVFSGAAQTIK